MYAFVLALHLIVCLCLVAVILVQSGKGGGLAGGAFGGATQTVFGGRGATDFVTRATVVLGVLFFVTSLSLALLSATGGPGGGGSKSLIQEEAKRTSGAQPTSGTPTGGGQTLPPANTPSPTGATPAPAPAQQTNPAPAPAGSK